MLGSAGSNRIRSALLQVIVNAVDLGLDAQAAVDAPRLHAEDGLVYTEPGMDAAALAAAGHVVSRFRGRNTFFGGCRPSSAARACWPAGATRAAAARWCSA